MPATVPVRSHHRQAGPHLVCLVQLVQYRPRMGMSRRGSLLKVTKIKHDSPFPSPCYPFRGVLRVLVFRALADKAFRLEHDQNTFVSFVFPCTSFGREHLCVPGTRKLFFVCSPQTLVAVRREHNEHEEHVFLIWVYRAKSIHQGTPQRKRVSCPIREASLRQKTCHRNDVTIRHPPAHAQPCARNIL